MNVDHFHEAVETKQRDSAICEKPLLSRKERIQVVLWCAFVLVGWSFICLMIAERIRDADSIGSAFQAMWEMVNHGRSHSGKSRLFFVMLILLMVVSPILAVITLVQAVLGRRTQFVVNVLEAWKRHVLPHQTTTTRSILIRCCLGFAFVLSPFLVLLVYALLSNG